MKIFKIPFYKILNIFLSILDATSHHLQIYPNLYSIKKNNTFIETYSKYFKFRKSKTKTTSTQVLQSHEMGKHGTFPSLSPEWVSTRASKEGRAEWGNKRAKHTCQWRRDENGLWENEGQIGRPASSLLSLTIFYPSIFPLYPFLFTGYQQQYNN